jgi:ABC-type transport system involved in resistance to organic solvents, auxiliary component
MNKPSRTLPVLLIGILFCRFAYAESETLKNLKTNITTVQQVLVDGKLADPQHRDERRRAALTLIQQIFDFQEMARRSLGANARRYNDRLEEFTPLFISLLEHAYMGKLEEYADAKIDFVKEVVDGGLMEVTTKTALKDGNEYSVIYKLKSGPADWRVYDVIIDGVSLVNNYRAQFDRFLSRKSFDELLQTLRDKNSGFDNTSVTR